MTTSKFPKTGEINSWKEVERANIQGGYFYFSDLDAFGSKTHDQPINAPDGKTYGIMSDKPPHYDNREYYIIQVADTGSVKRAHGSDGNRHLRYMEINEARDVLEVIESGSLDPSTYKWR